MTAVLPESEYRRLAKWLQRWGITAIPFAGEPAELVIGRRRARRRAGILTFCLGVIAIGLLLLDLIPTVAAGGDLAGGVTHHRLTIAAFVLADLVAALFLVIVGRAEVRLGRQFPRRLSRSTRLPVVSVLGRPAIGAVAGMVVSQLYLIGVAFEAGRPAAGWTLTALFVLSSLIAACGVTAAVTRPALAIDSITLALDDRLRTFDAVGACRPLASTVWIYFIVGGYDSVGGLAAVLIGTVASVLLNFAQSRGLHPTPAEPSQAPA